MVRRTEEVRGGGEAREGHVKADTDAVCTFILTMRPVEDVIEETTCRVVSCVAVDGVDTVVDGGSREGHDVVDIDAVTGDVSGFAPCKWPRVRGRRRGPPSVGRTRAVAPFPGRDWPR